MGLSDWAVLLRSDEDAAYWTERAAAGPRVRPVAVMRFVNATPSMHAYKFMPSGHYLLLVSAAARSSAAHWFDAAVRPGRDVFAKPGGGFRPDGWDECTDYAWESPAWEAPGAADVGAPASPPPDVVSGDAWAIPPAPVAEWMVHVDGPERLAAALESIERFNAAPAAAADPATLRLRVTRVVRQISGTKRLPGGPWLIAVNADAGETTARWWKSEFQWKGTAIAADAQSCHTVRRAKAVLWSAAAAPTAGEDGGGAAALLPTAAVLLLPGAVGAAAPAAERKKRKRPRSAAKTEEGEGDEGEAAAAAAAEPPLPPAAETSVEAEETEAMEVEPPPSSSPGTVVVTGVDAAAEEPAEGM